MTIDNLKNYLTIQEGKLTLTKDTLPGDSLKDFIIFFNENAPLIIEQAEEIQDNTELIVKGKTTFMGISTPIVAKFKLDLNNDPIINLEFNTSDQSVLSLKNFTSKYFPEFSDIPDLRVKTLCFHKDDNSLINVNVDFLEEPVWRIELGETFIIHNITLQLNQTTEGFIGEITGKTEINNDISLDIVYKLPGEFLLKVDYPSVNLETFIKKISGNQISFPPGFEVILPPSHAVIQFIDGNPSFHSVTEVEGLGLLIFSVLKQVNWRFNVVWNLDVSQPSSIPGLEAIAPLESLINISKVLMCIVSDETDLANLSKMAKKLATQFGYEEFNIPNDHQNLEPGMSILTGTPVVNNEPLQLLLDYFNVTTDSSNGFTISVSLPDPSGNSKLYIPFSSQIQEGTTIEGRLGGVLRGGLTQIFCTASVHTQIQGQPVQVDVESNVLPNGILISGTYRGTINFNPLPIQLSNLSLVIGLSGQGVPSFGFSGNIDIKNLDSSIALFFNSTQPSQSMIAGSVSSLTLNDVIRLFIGESLPDSLGQVLGSVGLKGISAFNMPTSALKILKSRDYQALSDIFRQHGNIVLPQGNNQVLLVEVEEGSHWAITNLTTMEHYSIFLRSDFIDVQIQPQLYCAPQETFIGSFKFPQGFHLDARINHLFFETQVRIVAEPNQGIAGKAEVDPIIISSPDFFSITGEDGRGARLSFSTFSQINEVEEGLRDPHFLLIGNIKLLGLDILKAHILINPDGISFKSVAEPFIHQLDWTASLDGTNFRSEGKLLIGIKQTLDAGSLGKTDIDVSVNATIRASIQNQLPSITCEGAFEFFGAKCIIPPFELSIDGKALSNLANSLWDYMKDILMKLLKNADYWLKMLRDGIIKGVEQVAENIGKLLSEVHQISAADIASKTQEILEYGPEKISEALKGAGTNPNEIVSVLQNIHISTDEIQSTLKKVFAGTHVDTISQHIDTPEGPHIDISESHQDIPESHQDIPENRIDEKFHVDTPRQHTDTRRLRFHTDITVIPHVDENNHTDTVTTPRVSVTTPHVDTGTPHVDNRTPPHGDTNIHVDTNES